MKGIKNDTRVRMCAGGNGNAQAYYSWGMGQFGY